MEVLITSLVNFFHGNKYNTYIHTARNAKVTSRNVYEKTVMKRKKVFRGVFRTHSSIYDEAFLKVHECRFENLPICSNSCKNNTLKIWHS